MRKYILGCSLLMVSALGCASLPKVLRPSIPTQLNVYINNATNYAATISKPKKLYAYTRVLNGSALFASSITLGHNQEENGTFRQATGNIIGGEFDITFVNGNVCRLAISAVGAAYQAVVKDHQVITKGIIVKKPCSGMVVGGTKNAKHLLKLVVKPQPGTNNTVTLYLKQKG